MAIQPRSRLEILVNSWPKNYETGWTLAKPVSRQGIGLHTGQMAEVRLLPSSKAGFHLCWLESPAPPVTLAPHHVRESQLCTTIEVGHRRLATVEHLFAALAGCGISHVEINVSGNEVPLLDGSAIGWVEAIQEAGLYASTTPRRESLVLQTPLICQRGTSVIVATPSEQFNLVGAIEFPHRAIGRQIMSIQLTPERFVKEIAPARTFGFRDQVQQLVDAGLIKGGGLDNALVCDGDNWLNPPLRFADEPIRHKLLDLIGDLALVGFPYAQILVYRGSHGLHNDLAAQLFKARPANSS